MTHTALVTGAAGGIGSAIVTKLVAGGTRVVAVDQPGHIGSSDDTVTWLAADLSDRSASQDAFAAAVEQAGRIDLLCNNAGIEGPTTPLADLDPDDFDRVLDINLRAAFLLTRLALRHMQGGGAIVNVASIAGLRASDGVPAYVISKHALVGLTRAAAREAARTGVRVNAVCPGPIDTVMMSTIETGLAPEDPGANRQAREGRIPLRRYGRADEVAAAVSWLASDEASFVNGSCLVIDGGSTA